jgi:hypothetical protein
VALPLHKTRTIMLRASLLLGLLSATLIPACTSQDAPDEFEGESTADGEEGKGDAAGVFGFLNVIADNRACSLNSPSGCGTGFFVNRANRSTIQCGRGPLQKQCKVMEIDWSGTAMPASVAQGYEDDLRAGKPLLVKGEIVPAPNDAGVSLSVTEIWVASNPEWADGVFALVKDNGIRCITAPCPSLTEQKLNSNLSANITGVDFDEARANGVEQEAIDLASDQMYGGAGVVVVGYRYYDSAGGKARTAAKFFTKAPVPLR